MQEQNFPTMQSVTRSESYTHKLNPVAWSEAIGLAERYCRTIQRKNGTPLEAVRSYGIADSSVEGISWEQAASLIALAISKPAHQRAC